MIAVLIKSTIIILAAACAARAFRRRSSAFLHVVWTAGLLGALAVPLCNLLLPPWRPEITGGAMSLLETAAALGADEPAGAAGSELPGGGVELLARAVNGLRPESAVLAIWLAGAGLGMLMILGGAAKLGLAAVRAEPVTDPRWTTAAQEIASQLNLRRPVRLIQNPKAFFLGVWGVIRPRVLLPAGIETWPQERIRMVLAHEMTHVKRNDWPIQVLAEAARAIYWFNPVFWLVCARLRRESEHACDNRVLELGVGGPAYAGELIALTRVLRDAGARRPALAMAQPSHLERRVAALLSPSLNRLAATPWAAGVVALTAIALTLPLAAIRTPEARKLNPAPPAGRSGSFNEGSQTVGAVYDRPVYARPTIVDSKKNARSNTLQRGASLSPASAADAGAGPVREIPAPEVSEFQAPAPALALEPIASACLVTPSVRATPPLDAKTASFGSGPWFINSDRSIWVWDQPYVAGKPLNTIWIRPQGEELRITGRRLDREAPPLEASIPCCYPTTFKASGLRFPTPGCWEVTATAGRSTLTFITNVAP